MVTSNDSHLKFDTFLRNNAPFDGDFIEDDENIGELLFDLTDDIL
jgi:hypothetical protein